MPNLSSAIIGEDGTVDPGYLGLFVVMWMILGTIPVALILIAVRMFLIAEHPLDLVGLAAIIGAAGTAFGAAAVGVGVFRRGDQPRPPPAPPATPDAIGNVAAAAAAAGASASDMESAGRGVERHPEPKRRKRAR